MEHELVSQAVVIGDRRKFLSALVGIDPEAATRFLREKGLGDMEATDHPAIEKALEAIESLKVAEFDEQGEPVDGEHAEQLREDIEEAVRKLTQGKSPANCPRA